MAEQQLGTAKGKIVLDASDVTNVAGKVQGAGKKIESSLGRVDAAAKKTSVTLGALGKVVGAVGGIFGVQMGIQLVRQLGDMVIASSDLATSYRRQQVAAVSLAGSQEKLNVLMQTYHEVTKNTVSDVKALADVTKLQATGFADSAAELTSFVNVARGISIAMGVDTEYVTGQLQLAIANQSFMRLDQIGLGVEEVKNRIKELKVETKGLSSEMAFQQAILEIAEQKFGKLNQSIEAQATGLERLRKAWKDARLEQGKNVEGVVDKTTGFFATEIEKGGIRAQVSKKQEEAIVKFIADTRTLFSRSAKGEINDEANDIASEAFKTFFAPITDWFEAHKLPETQREFDRRYGEGQWNPNVAYTGYVDEGYKGTIPTGGGVSGSGIEGEKQIAIVTSHYKAIEDIERQAANARITATEDFERRRTQIIRQYGLTLVRQAEDVALATSRATTDFNRSIADMRRDAGRRESDAREQLEESLGDLRKGHSERVAEITSRYHKDMEESEASHREKLLGAAARLDAAGVVQEQRRFAKEKNQKSKAFNDNLKREKKSLDKTEKQREEALEKQLETARRNDERRLDDMRRDFEYRKQIEQEDREIRLRRMAEDHNSQLEEMVRVHDARMEQINTQESERKIEQEDKFQDQLIQAGLAHEKWLEEQDAWEKKSLESFEDWWKDIDGILGNTGEAGDTTTGLAGGTGDDGSPVMRQFGEGGPVNRTGPAIVHAGEFVLNAGTVGALRGMMGNFSNAGLLQAAGSRSINIAEGAIQVTGSEGMNVEALGQVVRDELLAALQIAS